MSQGGVYGAPLAGRVLDPSGASVGGARIELVGPAGPLAAQTADDGSFVFADLPPGRYSVGASAPGFGPAESLAEIGDAPVDLTIRLELEEQLQQVEVRAEEPAGPPDPAGNANRIDLSGTDLQKLPALDGDVVETLRTLLDGGSFGGDGGGLVVDGVETDDLGVSPSAIQEIRIGNDPYSAEYSRPGNSRIEVITKRGAENFHGQVNLRVRDFQLDARNAFAAERPEQRRRALEGVVSGPIGRGGRHSFVVSGEHDRDREAALILASTPDGLVRGTAIAPEVETEISARWDFHPSDERAFSFRYEDERETAGNSGVGGFSLGETASDESQTDRSVYWSYRSVLGDSGLFEWSGRAGRESRRATSRSAAQRVVVQDAFTAGGAQRDSRSAETYAESAVVVSAQRGRHYWRAGLLLRDFARRTLTDRSNFGGTFEFASLADFEAGVPFAFRLRQGEPRIAFWDIETALFVQDNIRIGPRTSLAAGARWDRQNFGGDRNNVAPRLSLAHGFGGQGRTTVRLGGGIFYDNLSGGAYADLLRFGSRGLVREILLRNPAYPDPFAGGLAGETLPANRVVWAPRLSTPYVAQYGASVERRLTGGLTWSLVWTRRAGVGLLRSIDLNAPLKGGSRPDPEQGIVRELGSSARMESQQVQTQLRGKLGEVFQGMVRYSWGQEFSDVGDADTVPADSRDLSGEWGPTGGDRRHRADALGVFQVREWFDLGVALEAESARPYTLVTGTDDNGDGVARDRPAGVGRNTARGAGAFEIDVRLSKGFELAGIRAGEATRVTLMLDAFNVLNTVNPRNFVGNLSSPLFGQAAAAGAARRLQAGLRWSF